MNEKNPIDSLLEVLDSFRSKILKIKKMSETDFKKDSANLILDEGLLDLIKIKNLNEIVQLKCEDKKNECYETQDELGKINLNQKKYEYHLDLIKNDIYKSKQLPKLPESDKVLIDENDNKNKIEIESFKNILLGRKRLNEKLNDLKIEKKKNEGILKNKLNNMKDIPKYIDMIEKETNRTKKIFNDSKNIV